MTLDRISEARQHVVDLCLALSRKGYFAGTGGNLMLRLDATLVAVTPSATDYLTMRPQDVCVLRLDDLSRVSGELAPSVESSLHARVLKARPEVGCSIHTHQPVASACALLGRALEVPAAHRAVLGPRVPLVGYAPSGSGWLAGKLARALTPTSNAYLMRNHGILCCGADSDAAMRALDALERLTTDWLRERIAARAALEPAAHDALRRVLDLLPLLPASSTPDVPSTPRAVGAAPMPSTSSTPSPP